MQKSPTCAVFGAQQNVGRCLGRLGRFGDCAWEAQSQKTLQGPLANLANALGAWELSGKAGQSIEQMGPALALLFAIVNRPPLIEYQRCRKEGYCVRSDGEALPLPFHPSFRMGALAVRPSAKRSGSVVYGSGSDRSLSLRFRVV